MFTSKMATLSTITRYFLLQDIGPSGLDLKVDSIAQFDSDNTIQLFLNTTNMSASMMESQLTAMRYMWDTLCGSLKVIEDTKVFSDQLDTDSVTLYRSRILPLGSMTSSLNDVREVCPMQVHKKRTTVMTWLLNTVTDMVVFARKFMNKLRIDHFADYKYFVDNVDTDEVYMRPDYGYALLWLIHTNATLQTIITELYISVVIEESINWFGYFDKPKLITVFKDLNRLNSKTLFDTENAAAMYDIITSV